MEVPAALKSKIDEIVVARENLSDLRKQREPLDVRINAIVQDQTRLRENLKALRESKEEKELRQKYLDSLAGQEQQSNELRTRINDLLVRITEQDTAVAKMISELNWD